VKWVPNETTLNLDPTGRLCKNSLRALTASFIGDPYIDPLLSIRKMYSWIFGAISRFIS
jgi:hypothetical protein